MLMSQQSRVVFLVFFVFDISGVRIVVGSFENKTRESSLSLGLCPPLRSSSPLSSIWLVRPFYHSGLGEAWTLC